MTISDKKALKCVKALMAYCDKQRGCFDCIFGTSNPDNWNCLLNSPPFGFSVPVSKVEANIQAKKIAVLKIMEVN